MQQSAYKIFNASAGSGKTFTLVKEYLKILLSSDKNQKFRQILAVTFTNKAVNEMKGRILSSLAEISEDADEKKESEMALLLSKELGVDQSTLRQNAKVQLRKILHNYAYFDVSTIDKFTHRVIRTFARDLKLSHNFEVLLDTDLLLEESIDNLMSKAGQDKQLTQALIDFALVKTDSDKYWDLHNDLFKAGKMIFRENDLPHLKRLVSKSINDFITLQKHLRSEKRKIEKSAALLADKALGIIADSDLTEDDFPRKTLPGHFMRIKRLDWDLDTLYDNKLEENLQAGNILKSGSELPYEEFPLRILDVYQKAKTLIMRWALLENAYQNLLPLSVLNAMYLEIRQIEDEKDVLPISSFNSIIAETIANQPAPFIYERLGEKYRYYFIDEFQDTSQMQWNNLIPLVSNAIESVDNEGNTGSLMLVGDVKQAIYRWRGGRPEQFLDLITQAQNPFVLKPTVHSLDTNFRSAGEIIRFNNAFFKSVSYFISNPAYRHLFAEETQQKFNSKEGGFVNIDFLDANEESMDELYSESVRKAIHSSIEKGYQYSDICILTRKKKHGILLSEHLIESGIPVVSSETLLLSSSTRINFLIDILKLANLPHDKDIAFAVFNFLIPRNSDYHNNMQDALGGPQNWLLKHHYFDLQSLHYQSVYDGLEEAIRLFGLASDSDAFIAYLLDEVLKLEKRQDTGIVAFLDFWEKNIDKLSVTAPDNLEAVKIMTIHKAKGLEFPIVIFPYANTNIYYEKDAKLWQGVDKDEFCGFQELLFGKKKQMVDYGEEFSERFTAEQEKLELDAFNILYVALTRAIEALFIITKKDLDAKGSHKTSLYSGLFIHYLNELGLWTGRQDSYSFGELNPRTTRKFAGPEQESIEYMISNRNETAPKMVIKNAALWDDQRMMAIERGTIIHYILSQINTISDLDEVMKRTRVSGMMNEKEAEGLFNTILQIIKHPELSTYYREGLDVKNEHEIICENGLILRPDRLIIDKEKATIIDYKTGSPKSEHREQLITYGSAIIEMGFDLDNRIIVYINDDIEVEYI